MSVSQHIFRGYDIRGLVEKELSDEVVATIAKAYATWLIKRRIPDCVVGFDCRLSSPHFRDIVVETLLSAGITVYDIGMTLTQVAYFAQYYFRTRGMIMITASHNPKEYNGFKFGTGYSETMLTEDIQLFKHMVNEGEFVALPVAGKHIRSTIFPAYIADLKRYIGPIKSFKVVIDACAATAGAFLPQILREFGCTVIEQNTVPDGNFPVGTPDPTESIVQRRLADRVKLEQADVGFSYDADGDRMGAVDEQGKLLWNDTLVSLFAGDILDNLPGAKIVFNTLCSKQVTEVIKRSGGVPVMWKTGHSFIKAKVREEGAAFGGELSGHFYFVDNFYGHDDGAIASLRLLAYLTRKKKTLGQVLATFPSYISSPEIKLGCPDNEKFHLIDNEIQAELRRLYPEAEYVTIDGVRLDTKDEMVIMRASQNGPYLTIKFEAKTLQKYNLLKEQISAILHQFANIDWSEGVNVEALK
ncbi:MAG: phosphomannomutase/phosphoglucomutase [Candidatus Abawacabacteria bacterium]|nr:phosphomannomutase/phosphoglucomutase [Candidatus Abawacabacteria bacterium]